jgi:putative ABC transport system permease protein
MFKNYIKTAIRNIWRDKISSMINIFGLAIGIASFILIFLYVYDEVKYDKYNKKTENIYRLLVKAPNTGNIYAIQPGVMYDFLSNSIPEIEATTRISHRDGNVSYNDKVFFEKNFLMADPAIFQIFSWNLKSGNPQTVLNEPHSIVLSESMAEKYFGDDNPVGKILTYNNEYDFTVTGIMEDIPLQSHLRPDFVASIQSLKTLNPSALSEWLNSSVNYYFLVSGTANIEDVEGKIQKSIIKNGNSDFEGLKYILQPLDEIHLYSGNIKWDDSIRGNIVYVRGFLLIAVLILLIACFNYINLSTAGSFARAKEIGIRKVVGADRHRLMGQFLGESVITVLFAFIIAIAMVEVLGDSFSTLTGKDLSLHALPFLHMVILFSAIILIIAFVAGSYPAFILSKFKPVSVLKGSKNINGLSSNKKTLFNLRYILTVFQFTITTALIVSSVIIYKQLNLIRDKNMGFDKDNLVVIENPWDSLMTQRYKTYKNRLSQNPDIVMVSAAYNVPPGEINNYSRVRPPEMTEEEGGTLGLVAVDYNYFKTIGAKIIKGRDFSEKNASDANNTCILNEAAVKKLKLENPVGQRLSHFYDTIVRTVVGVVGDIHYRSLHEPVKPMVFFVSENEYPMFSPNIIIRLNSKNKQETMAFLQDEFKKLAPKWTVNYYFVDEKFNSLYRSEENAGKIITLFTLLAIFVSSFGLFGLVLFITASKTKEIGIRKVLGASIATIRKELMHDFVVLIIIAYAIAFPVSYYVMDRWLENFTVTVSINYLVFLIAAVITFVIAYLTVIYIVHKAATTNPAEAIKYE